MIITIKEAIAFLSELPENTFINTTIIEDKTTTIQVDNNGVGRVYRNALNERWLVIELPLQQ